MGKALEHRVLRQGDKLTLPRQALTAQHVSTSRDDGTQVLLHVLTCEPFVQGYLVGEADSPAGETSAPLTATKPTAIVLLDLSDGTLDAASAFSTQGRSKSAAKDHEPAQDQEADVLIDESFLLLGDQDLPGPSTASGPEPSSTVLLHPQSIGDLTHWTWSLSGNAAQAPPGLVADDLDEGATIFVNESTLGKLGLFNGDWAIAHIVRNTSIEQIDDVEPSSQRAIRVVSVSNTDSSVGGGVGDANEAVAYLPSTLLFNMRQDSALKASTADVLLRLAKVPRHGLEEVRGSSPGHRAALPFAESITIARVASRATLQKAQQEAFLGALKRFFQQKARVLKVGDLIEVSIEEGIIQMGRVDRSAEADHQGTSSREAEILLHDIDHLLKSEHHPAASLESWLPEVSSVFFRVTSLVPELQHTPILSSAPDSVEYLRRSWSGGLGCVVDSSLTKMVQMSVINAQQPSFEVARLQAATTARRQLWNLLRPTIEASTAAFGLELSVLLTGASGNGQRDDVRELAARSGLNRYEIDCFDCLSDTEARSVGMLQAHFERAGACRPVILILLNIEALARKSQVLESGQEPAMTTVLRDCFRRFHSETGGSRQGHLPAILVATTEDAETVPASMLALFKQSIDYKAPDETARRTTLCSQVEKTLVARDVSIQAMAIQTAALLTADLREVTARARLSAIQRSRHCR